VEGQVAGRVRALDPDHVLGERVPVVTPRPRRLALLLLLCGYLCGGGWVGGDLVGRVCVWGGDEADEKVETKSTYAVVGAEGVAGRQPAGAAGAWRKGAGGSEGGMDEWMDGWMVCC
jgi:hypothetical protein